jgi:Flp pilus assembly secretin CpaC
MKIAIGDPCVADFMASPTRVELEGFAVGRTNVLVWDEQGRLRSALDIRVVPGKVRSEERESEDCARQHLRVWCARGDEAACASLER